MVLQDCGGPPLLVTASYQVSHSQAKRATWLEMRSCPLPRRAGLHSRTPQQGPGPLSANWDNLEDHSSSRTYFPETQVLARSCDLLFCLFLLPSLPTITDPQATP